MNITQIIAILVIAICAILFIAWKVYKEGLRATAIDFIVEAERLYEKGGVKKEYVIQQLIKIIPLPFSLFISEKMIDDFMQKIFDEIKTALDYRPQIKEGE